MILTRRQQGSQIDSNHLTSLPSPPLCSPAGAHARPVELDSLRPAASHLNVNVVLHMQCHIYVLSDRWVARRAQRLHSQNLQKFHLSTRRCRSSSPKTVASAAVPSAAPSTANAMCCSANASAIPRGSAPSVSISLLPSPLAVCRGGNLTVSWVDPGDRATNYDWYTILPAAFKSTPSVDGDRLALSDLQEQHAHHRRRQ
jgi:hypothetical protein